MKYTTKYIPCFFLFCFLSCKVTYNKNPTKFIENYPISLTYVSDNIVDSANLCALLNLEFIEETKIEQSKIIRLDNSYSTNPNPPKSFCEQKLPKEFKERSASVDGCRVLNNYLNILNEKSTIYIYSTRIDNVCTINGSKPYNNLNDLNSEIVKEISTDRQKNKNKNFIIYVPSKVEKSLCDSSNVKFNVLFDNNEYQTLYGIDEEDPNIHKLYPPDHNDESFYLICDSICSVDKFILTIEHAGNILYEKKYNKDNLSFKNYKGRYVFQIPFGINDIEYHTKVYDINIKPIKSTTTNYNFPSKTFKATFTSCAKN
jgi:hypothetical protein